MDDDNVNLNAQVANEVVPSTRSSRMGINFSIDDDKLLVVSWLNTSKDAFQGNSQISNKYWEQITTCFNNHATNFRTQASIKQRWGEVDRGCQLFWGILSQIERKNSSCQTDHGRRLEEAKKMYIDLENEPFLLEHCWVLVKDEPRWHQSHSNKRQKYDNDIFNESTSLGDDNDEPSVNNERPIRTKAAQKIASSSSISDEILQERLQIEKAKYEQRNRALLEQEKNRELKQRKLELKEKESERQWELEVMTKNFQGMSPIKLEYWQNERKQIMAKKGFKF